MITPGAGGPGRERWRRWPSENRRPEGWPLAAGSEEAGGTQMNCTRVPVP